jgi:hypothetical protein
MEDAALGSKLCRGDGGYSRTTHVTLQHLFLIVNLNFENIALIVVRGSAGAKLSIVVVRVFVLQIAVSFVFVVLKRMVVVLLTLETTTI